MRLPIGPLPQGLAAFLMIASLAVVLGAGSQLVGRPSSRTLASALTPQVSATSTPTTVPTPVVQTPVATSTVAPTPAATSTPAARTSLSFSLDAARVSKVGNAGDLSGLASVKPGTRVWLMMYYTVRSIPKNLQRITMYEIDSGSNPVFRQSFRTTIKRTELGRFSRYTVYTVPASLRYGPYRFRAVLSIGKVTRAKGWKFRVGKQELPATP